MKRSKIFAATIVAREHGQAGHPDRVHRQRGRRVRRVWRWRCAVLDVVFGKHPPSGKSPFDLPGDMPSVMAQAAGVPFDMDDPLFKFGFGLGYGR